MLASLDAETIALQTERYTIEIFLNVYDVTQTPGDPKSTVVRLNKITRELNLGGVFHGAIQIGAGTPVSEAIEFSFGWCERGTGVYAVHARQNPMYQYRETLSLGLTPKTMAEVKEIVQQFKLQWQGPTYDLLTRNCCHFCEDLAVQLEVQPVPGWLNRFASGAAATVSMTQETVKTIQDIGEELGRLSGESLSFIKASFAKAASVASQQQQQLAERIRLQRDSQAAAAGGVISSRSTPQLQAAASQGADADAVEDYYGQQGRQQQQRRVASDADIVIHGSGGSSRAGTAWLGRFQSMSSLAPPQLARDEAGSSSAKGTAQIASSAAAAGQSLLAGMQQAGRQLKATTSKLGIKLSQTVQQAAQQQQQNAAAQDSWEAAGGLQQAASTMQQQQQQHSGGGGGLLPAAQPKLAAQYRVDSADGVNDPLASLLLSDDDELEFKSVTSGGSEVASALASPRLTNGGSETAAAVAPAPAQHLLD